VHDTTFFLQVKWEKMTTDTWRLRRVERDSSPIWYNGLGVQFQSDVSCIGSMAERAQHYCHQKTCYSRKQNDGTIHTMI
jgi:hypothetical protein